jgi:hypothetical protein
MTTRPKLKASGLSLIVIFMVALAAGNYFVLQQAPFGTCTLGPVPTGAELSGYDWIKRVLPSCLPYVYYLVGAPLAVGLLLLLSLPRLVTGGEVAQEAKSTQASAEPRRPAPPPTPPKPSADAAVQLLALFQREGRLVDFLREDIQPYDDAQIGAAVRTIHQACRQVLAEHVTLEPVLTGHEGDEITVAKDFDPSAVRLTGNVSGEPPFRGALRHAGWRATQIKLPAQPAGQDPKVVTPAEVEIP